MEDAHSAIIGIPDQKDSGALFFSVLQWRRFFLSRIRKKIPNLARGPHFYKRGIARPPC